MAEKTGEKIRELKARIADIATLEVQTFTGKLVGIVNAPGDATTTGSILNWPELLNKAKTPVRGEVFLAASTRIQVGGDTDVFIAADIDPKVLQAHDASVKSAQEMRRSIIAMFRDILDKT